MVLVVVVVVGEVYRILFFILLHETKNDDDNILSFVFNQKKNDENKNQTEKNANYANVCVCGHVIKMK